MKQSIVNERKKQGIVTNSKGVFDSRQSQTEIKTEVSSRQGKQDIGRQFWADTVLRTKNNDTREEDGASEEYADEISGIEADKESMGYSHYLSVLTNAAPASQASREAMIKLCGIREHNRFSGVKTRKQKMSQMLSDDEQIDEPWICSEEERKRLEERRFEEEKKEDNSSGNSDEVGPWFEEGNIFSEDNEEKTSGSNREKGCEEKEREVGVTKKEKEGKTNGSNHARRELLRRYFVKELIHEQGKTDPESHFKLVGQLIKNELQKPMHLVGKLIRRGLLKLLGMIISFILPSIPMMIAAFALIYFLVSPLSFFLGLFDQDEVAENPQNITNVVQEMYVEFYGGISTFEDIDANNQVEYIYANASKSREVIAVYLTEICMSDNYQGMSVNDGYPAYLLVDTQAERERLTAIFEQFNYTETEEITVNGTNEDGEEWEAEAEKMSVYCLSIDQWKSEHLSELSRKEQNLLKTLLDQVARENETVGSGSFSGTGTSVPISELVIPEGVDENLVYMAGFIKAEAGNQPYQGKVAVAYVILNRAGGASGNIKGVLTAPYQFSCYIPYHTVERYLQEYASMTDSQRLQDACWKAAVDAYSGSAANPIGGMKYYCNPAGCSAGESEQWRRIRANNNGSEILVIGDHVFCQNCW